MDEHGEREVQQLRQQRHRRSKTRKTSLFIKIYEDNISGKLNDERFSMMSVNYETEQKRLKVDMQLQQDIQVQERQNKNLETFIQKVQQCEDLTGLTPKALCDMAKAIYVSAPEKSNGKRRQDICISYDEIGFIPLNELIKEKTA